MVKKTIKVYNYMSIAVQSLVIIKNSYTGYTIQRCACLFSYNFGVVETCRLGASDTEHCAFVLTIYWTYI